MPPFKLPKSFGRLTTSATKLKALKPKKLAPTVAPAAAVSPQLGGPISPPAGSARLPDAGRIEVQGAPAGAGGIRLPNSGASFQRQSSAVIKKDNLDLQAQASDTLPTPPEDPTTRQARAGGAQVDIGQARTRAESLRRRGTVSTGGLSSRLGKAETPQGFKTAFDALRENDAFKAKPGETPEEAAERTRQINIAMRVAAEGGIYNPETGEITAASAEDQAAENERAERTRQETDARIAGQAAVSPALDNVPAAGEPTAEEKQDTAQQEFDAAKSDWESMVAEATSQGVNALQQFLVSPEADAAKKRMNDAQKNLTGAREASDFATTSSQGLKFREAGASSEGQGEVRPHLIGVDPGDDPGAAAAKIELDSSLTAWEDLLKEGLRNGKSVSEVAASAEGKAAIKRRGEAQEAFDAAHPEVVAKRESDRKVKAEEFVETLMEGGTFWDDAGNPIDLDRAHDSTGDHGHTTLEWGGVDYNIEDPDSWPDDLRLAVRRNGGSIEAFQQASRDGWLEEHRPGASEEELAVFSAILEANGAGGLFMDEDDGIVDRNGEIVEGVGWASIWEGAKDPELYEGLTVGGRMIADLINKANGTLNAGDQAEVKRAADFEKELEELRQGPEFEPLDSDKMLSANREKAASDKARTMRSALNRMARGGSSPEAISGTTAQLNQQYDVALAQQEAVIEFQTQVQNMNSELRVWEGKLQTAVRLFETAANREEREKAAKLRAWAEAGMRDTAARKEAAANRFNLGKFLGQAGMMIGGAVLGGFTGGASTVAAGAVTGLFGGGGGGGSPTSQISGLPQGTQLIA